MDRPAPNQPADLWLVDGSLRDVYIFNTTAADWDALLLLAQTYPHEYAHDGVSRPLPSASALFQDGSHSHILRVLAGSVGINCHFFVSDEIELDIDPKEVKDPAEHLAVLQFLEQLAQATRKDAVVTLENSPEIELLRYSQAGATWVIHEPRTVGEA